MEILINNAQTKHKIDGHLPLITRGFRTASALEEVGEDLEVSLSFVDDSRIQELNRLYRGLDLPTDVLSFPQDQEGLPPGAPRLLGDIVISLERAALQARRYGHSLQREVLYLALHGFFHLLGYDHETAAGQRAMRAREKEVLAILARGDSLS